ncbi:MAG: hypothetical protein KAQ94_05780 [Arcobacteraceae bacterium]|nr:hypothetical protein [Arcobacteraceae bacterium]
MTVLIDKSSLYSTFNVSCFDELESSINKLSPSMTEYYLSDIASLNNDSSHLNKTNVQKSLLLDKYYLYLDYSNNVFLEITKDADDEFETGTLW